MEREGLSMTGYQIDNSFLRGNSSVNTCKILDVATDSLDFARLKRSPSESGWLSFEVDIVAVKNGTSLELELQEPMQPLPRLTHSKTLYDSLKTLEPSSLSETLTLLVSGGETERVRKAVVCAQSPVFARMLDSPMLERRTDTIDVTDVRLPVLQHMVSFLYTGRIRAGAGAETLRGLYYVADKYEILGLRDACIKTLEEALDESSICDLLCLARRHGDDRLQAVAEAYLKDNLDMVLQTHEWESLMREDLRTAIELYSIGNGK